MRLAEQTAMGMINVENSIFASWSKEDAANYPELTEKYMRAIRSKARDMC